MILHILFSYDCILCHLNLNLVSFVMFLRKYPRKIGRNPIRNSTAALSFVWFPPSPPPSPSPTSECRKQNKIQQKRHHIKLLTWMVYAIAATVYVITWLYGQLTAVAFRFLTITGEMKSIRCSMQRFPSVCVCVCLCLCVYLCVSVCVSVCCPKWEQTFPSVCFPLDSVSDMALPDPWRWVPSDEIRFSFPYRLKLPSDERAGVELRGTVRKVDDW